MNTEMNEELRKDFDTLGVHVDEIDSLTVDQAKAAYHKAALITHPDKADPACPKQVADFTAAFQELGNCYQRVLKHIIDRLQAQEDTFEPSTDETILAKDSFNQFNFPFENQGSFTVQVEDNLADIWQECLEIVYGVPRIVVCTSGAESDRFWKTLFSLNEREIQITIHFYNHKNNDKKQSKIRVQGAVQSFICEYVFIDLPKIYKMVCLRKPSSGTLLRNSKRKRLGTPVKRRNTKHKPIAKPETLKCAMCDFTSVSNVKLIRHMKTNHTEPSRKNDDPICPMVDDEPTQKIMDEDMSVCEVSVTENHSEMGTEKLLFEKNSCKECEFVCSREEDLERHFEGTHGRTIMNKSNPYLCINVMCAQLQQKPSWN